MRNKLLSGTASAALCLITFGGAARSATIDDVMARLDRIERENAELRAKVRDASGTTDIRHVGIDGPRWFVHGVYLGSAAFQPERAGPLLDVMRGLVVERGTEARPVSEALPLQLPPEAAAQLEDSMAPDHQAT